MEQTLKENTLAVNSLAESIHADNVAVGWWDNDPCVLTKLQLVNTELAEATEGERKDLMDDHLPHRKMGEVELADAAIRMLDLAGRMDWGYLPEEAAEHIETHNPFFEACDTIAAKHGLLTSFSSALFVSVMNTKLQPDMLDYTECDAMFTLFMWYLLRTGEEQGYDIELALNEKCAYNAQRADHKRENRAKEGGKKF